MSKIFRKKYRQKIFLKINRFYKTLKSGVGSVVECRHCGRVVKAPCRRSTWSRSKLTRTILVCPWERHFMALFPAWWSWQAVLNQSYISIKLQEDSNILASPKAGRDNCLIYVLAPPSLSCESGG